MNLYVAHPYEKVRDRLMANHPPQPEFVPEAMDILPQAMITPEGVEVSPAATRKSSRVPKEPTRAPDQRKKGTSKEEDPLAGKPVTKRSAAQSASRATIVESMPLRQKSDRKSVV